MSSQDVSAETQTSTTVSDICLRWLLGILPSLSGKCEWVPEPFQLLERGRAETHPYRTRAGTSRPTYRARVVDPRFSTTAAGMCMFSIPSSTLFFFFPLPIQTSITSLYYVYVVKAPRISNHPVSKDLPACIYCFVASCGGLCFSHTQYCGSRVALQRRWSMNCQCTLGEAWAPTSMQPEAMVSSMHVNGRSERQKKIMCTCGKEGRKQPWGSFEVVGAPRYRQDRMCVTARELPGGIRIQDVQRHE
jgi:hypothetical protein